MTKKEELLQEIKLRRLIRKALKIRQKKKTLDDRVQLEEELKKEKGTNETLERQVVQSNIKNKVMQADVEINKKKNEDKARIDKDTSESRAKQKILDESNRNKAVEFNTEIENYISQPFLCRLRRQNYIYFFLHLCGDTAC